MNEQISMKKTVYYLWKGLSIGLFAGAISILYRILLGLAESWREKGLEFFQTSWITIVILAILLLSLAGIVRFFLKTEPLIGGSGIPQVEGEYRGKLQSNPGKVLVCKIVGGFLSILGGLSLGREGPSVQLGAMGANLICKPFKTEEEDKDIFLLCGAAAGLSAAFNAPLAGVLFAIEEVHKKVSPKLLFSVMVSSVTADFISKCVFGVSPVFSFPQFAELPLKSYWILLLFGIVLGILGSGFNTALLFAQKQFLRLKDSFWRLAIVFLLSGVLAFVLPQVLGGGHSMIELLSHRQLTLTAIGVLLLVKFLFSVISFGSGAPGGIFFPLLVQGAYIGAIFASLFVSLGVIEQNVFFAFAVLSMAGFFTSIVHAPLTGIVLICEMTGGFGNLLPITIVCIVSYLTTSVCKNRPIYDSLLERMMK